VIGVEHDIRGMEGHEAAERFRNRTRMMRRTILALAALAAVAVAFACGDNRLDPLPFQVSAAASSLSPSLGDTVNFVVTAQGGQLVGMTVDYGDNGTDMFGTGGARTARVTFRHPYAARGTFQFRATVTDALAGQLDATVDVKVQ
jgi:hypothetical protein